MKKDYDNGKKLPSKREVGLLLTYITIMSDDQVSWVWGINGRTVAPWLHSSLHQGACE